MAPVKSKGDGEEKAPTSSRVTRSMDRRTRSATQQNGAKAAGSVVTKQVKKLASPAKRKKPSTETGRGAKKAKKEEKASQEVEKDEEEEEAGAEEEEVGDSTKPKIVIEHWYEH